MGAFMGWVDADTFYCNAERVRYPMLRGVPLGVLGNNGACVIARTPELKAAGIRVGDPVWEAKHKCRDSVFLKRDFDWLGDISGKMLEEIRTLSPLVEYFSIDEMGFLPEPLRGSFQRTAEAVRHRIKEEVGVPTTTGIARTRTLAKLLCDASKPFGAAAVLDRGAEEALLAAFPVSELCGIGSKRAARLAECGIYNCLEFARADRRLIRRLLTVVGEAIWYEVNGEPVLPLKSERPRHKMLSRGGSLGRETADPYMLLGWMVRNLERLVEEFRFYRVKPGRVALLVCYRQGRDRHGIHRGGRSSVVPPSDRFDFLFDHFCACLRAAYVRGAAATRMHLFAEQLASEGQTQLSLFDTQESDAVESLKEQVNAKHGRFALRSAATLALPEIYADPATFREVCDIRGKHCF
jgi:nucleotidyltransferase/DNA polymerase involved in DNA repair